MVVSFLRFCKRVEVEVVCYLFILEMGEMCKVGGCGGVSGFLSIKNREPNS